MASLFDKFFKKAPEINELSSKNLPDTSSVGNLLDLSFAPAPISRDADLQSYKKLSFAELAASGSAFAALSTPLRTITQQVQIPTDGIYRAHIGKNGVLAKSGNYSLGNIMGEKGIIGQARWEKLNNLSGNMNITLPYDPTLMVLAVAMHEINQRFDEIKEIGLEILNFLEQDKEAQMRSDLSYLQDVLLNYPHNCNNEKFKTNQHIKVLDIKKDAQDKIELYHSRIEQKKDKQLGPIHAFRNVNDQHKSIQKEFKNYQLALYVYAFATFLDVMLLENFESDYVDNMIDGIKQRARSYNKLYEACFARIESQARSALENQVIGGVGTAIKAVGKTIAKIPIVSMSPVDETLIAAGGNLLEYRKRQSRKTATQLEAVQDNMVYPFVENLHTVKRLYNKPLDILFDQNYLYVKSIQE